MAEPAPTFDLTDWPPPGAIRVEVADLYDTLSERGYGYGPVFQGLKAAWTVGDDILAEVELDESVHADARRFGLHPALLDSTMHALGLHADDFESGSAEDGRPALPFFWEGIRLFSSGPTALRVRLTRSDDTVSLAMADAAGEPVLSVDGLTLRPVSVEQLVGSGGGGGLHEVVWRPLVGAGAAVSGVVGGVFEVPVLVGVDPVVGVRSVLGGVLEAVQGWLEGDEAGRLVVVTRGAVSLPGDVGVDVCGAPVWGLVRAAEAENPGRFVLVDVDSVGGSFADVADAVVGSGESEVAVRGGELLVPRLVEVGGVDGGLPVVVPGGVVLVTGGTGGLGGLVARHLVEVHGVRRLVLAGRRGAEAPGVGELCEVLRGLGAEVSVVACDVSDRGAVAGLVEGVGAGLVGVVHAAGAGDNGLVGSMDGARLDRALGAKADGAWYLHELTRELDLAFFVLFSSAGGSVLAAGQANYAAANVFLDALAVQRRAEGLPATSLAYGLWAGAGMGQWLGEADLERMRRQGLPALQPDQGLALFDAGLASGRAALVPLPIDVTALRTRTDTIPALLRDLAPTTTRRRSTVSKADATSLRRRFAQADEAGQEALLMELVLGRAATLLGHSSTDALDAQRDFLESGFDSLSAMELRNALMKDTGLRLPPMVVFDSKSPAELARLLRTELLAAGPLATGDSAGQGASAGSSVALGAAQSATGSGEAEAASADGQPETLRDMFHAAVVSGRADKGFALLQAAADVRPGFGSLDEIDRLPAAVRLADAAEGPHLICLSTPMATGGVHQHARLVSHFGGRHRISALPVPGFLAGESLPTSSDAAVQALARSVLDTAGGKPFVLLGYSSGGTLAYATAGHLERECGVRPAGVILLDTFKVHDGGSEGVPLDGLALGMFDKEAVFGRFDSSRLSAMGRWVELVPQLPLNPVEAPVLFVQCTQSFVPDGDDLSPDLVSGRAAPWEAAHTLRTVRANHFTLVEDRADQTAQVIDAWLASQESAPASE
ncbi:type I polyketide synthase [Streptomyces sp. RTGN2]|uniref:type I polyketide synthase n=1 Tax=Streptomyces sp. RTGN2 TaxID=3016525 RepID=UPI00333A6BD5